MGRKSTFYDQQFRGDNWDPDDQGDFERGLVFVAMSLAGQEMDDVFVESRDSAIRSTEIIPSVGAFPLKP